MNLLTTDVGEVVADVRDELSSWLDDSWDPDLARHLGECALDVPGNPMSMANAPSGS